MSAISPQVAAQPAVLCGIDWRTYRRLQRAFAGRRFRLTYDRGTLEIMSPLMDHERPAYWLGRFIEVLAEELRIPFLAGRSVTIATGSPVPPEWCARAFWTSGSIRPQTWPSRWTSPAVRSIAWAST